jgi:tRNA nucleotidyltransferase (CCA-adding enzyme)
MRKIVLTQKEQAIFRTLLDFNEATGRKTVYRVAGGWVRDHLLGRESDDIDIALDDCTGVEFSDAFAKFCKGKGIVGRVYVVAANPDKSKHLETVGISIDGQKIDFVNLRSETYGDSRIPTMEMGTPKTDAQRRDLTINAVFYNINTESIEDYVGGVMDLESGILATPLEPRRTFLDDPLRCLRTFRFQSKFRMTEIERKTFAALSDPEIHEAYMNKVSSERAGPEIMKLLAGRNVVRAIRCIFATGFDKALFGTGYHDIRIDQRNRHHAHDLLEHTLQVVDRVAALTEDEDALGCTFPRFRQGRAGHWETEGKRPD